MEPKAPPATSDRELLTFIGVHRFVLPAQAAALLDGDADAARKRLRELADDGYLIEEPAVPGGPMLYRATRLGLDAIGSRLRPLGISLTSYWHDVGAAWLWLAAHAGAFGPMHDVLAERSMRSLDAKGRNDPFGVRLGGVGRDGRERLHYPDLLMIGRDGRRIAIELEITSKSPVNRQRILAGYAADPRIAKVLYVVYDDPVARALNASISRMHISSLVAIQRVRGPERRPPAAPRARTIARRDQRRVAELAR